MSDTTYYHPHISGSVPNEALAEVGELLVKGVLDMPHEVRVTMTRREILDELLPGAVADVAGQWGNIDPQALRAAVVA